jgi:Ca2+-transporting ATPase
VGIGLAATAAYLAGRELVPEAAQTMAFSTIALAELLFVFSMRSPYAPAWRGPRNPVLVASVVLSASLVALVVYLPPAQGAFGTVSLDARKVTLVLGLAALPTALVELAKSVRRRRRR